ncbi:MAG: peptidylprolyl isomerase, partial [Gammaproteobacteria bacterium]|nr:peptidylprolyl isomerase [Gammaproteobacteria bacterium]
MDITAAIETSKGTINITLFPDKTPVTVASFVNLAQKNFYDDLNF